MKKLRILAILILILFLINLWSGLIYYSATGGDKLGKFSKYILAFSEFPKTMFKSLQDFEYHFVSQTYLKVDPDFAPLNTIPYDLYTLHSYWNEEDNNWTFNLLNLKNDSILYSWKVYEDALKKFSLNRPFRDLRPLHTLIAEDKSLILNFPQSNNVLKIDSLSAVVWRNNELGYHHSMEPDAEGNIWICASKQGEYITSDTSKWYSTKVRNLDRADMTFTDDLIVKLNPQTGDILFQKSISEILVENDFGGLLLNSVDFREDPIHINDIQPSFDSTAYWDKGDLFLSLRNLSSIVIYRPSTNKVIWLSQGPFLNQHDVDILSDKEISIFNNNMNWSWGFVYSEDTNAELSYSLKNNELITYDFEKKEFSRPYVDLFMNEKINTRSEGLVQFISNGDVFVEEQNIGAIFIFSKGEVIFRKTFNTPLNEWTHMTNWLRVYESNPIK